MLFDEKYSKCKIDQPKVVSKENGIEHCVNNPTRLNIYQYHIDGDIINDITVKKCDYIVEVTKEKPIAFVIELKGSHLPEAIEQLKSTIDRFKNKLSAYDIRPRVVIKRKNTTGIYDSKIREFERKYSKIRIEARRLEETV